MKLPILLSLLGISIWGTAFAQVDTSMYFSGQRTQQAAPAAPMYTAPAAQSYRTREQPGTGNDPRSVFMGNQPTQKRQICMVSANRLICY